MGDGIFCVVVDKRKCAVSANMRIDDPDVVNLEECSKIFQKLGFSTSLYEEKVLPSLSIWCNWNLLVWVVFKNRMLLENPFDWIKLLIILKRMKQWKTSYRFILFDRPMSSCEFGKLTGLKSEKISLWLQRKEREGLIKRVRKFDGYKIVWDLTNKGKEFRKLLIEINKLNNDINELLGTSDFNDIRNIIKRLNRNEASNRDLMIRIFDWLVFL